mmetsp:Transcript_109192/g.305529  ORF Transcript_109192/g.305529 Transcript_109192/m.305529 type:complete len:221 (-) Transcript_109192:213-875(-)
MEKADRASASIPDLYDFVLTPGIVDWVEEARGPALELVVQVEHDRQLRPSVPIQVPDKSAVPVQAAARPTAVGVDSEDILRVVLVQAPTGVQTADRAALHLWREVRLATPEDGLVQLGVGDPHAVLVLPDAAVEGDGGVLGVAHGLAELHELVTLPPRQHVSDHEAAGHARRVRARGLRPGRLVVEADGAGDRCEDRQVVAPGAALEADDAVVRAFAVVG